MVMIKAVSRVFKKGGGGGTKEVQAVVMKVVKV